MLETQRTSTSNTYFDIVSVLYHALREEQTCAIYAEDAQKSGDQDLVRFFGEVKQNASRQADRAKELLSRAKS
jgi:rubrerythrin